MLTQLSGLCLLDPVQKVWVFGKTSQGDASMKALVSSLDFSSCIAFVPVP